MWPCEAVIDLLHGNDVRVIYLDTSLFDMDSIIEDVPTANDVITEAVELADKIAEDLAR